MKSDFMSHVSHELRTPLTAIKEASSMLREGIYKDSPEKQDQLLSIVNGECERLISFVSRILDLSRLEAHMVDYQSEPAPLMPLIQNIVSKLAPIAQRKQITLELIPSPNLPEVTIDQARVAQVMENLLGNALKYTDSGGRVMVKTGILKGDNRFIGVSVTDSGIGIPAENLPKIFDKFTQAQVEGGPAKGTGLGLSIAKHIIREHGGRIWVKSKPGEGSTFFFTLPASSR
jgi:two-component system sensor histidine kinase GlrK